MGGLLLKWIFAPLVLFGAGFAAGWTVHDWKDASAQLAATRRVVAVVQAQGAINTRAAATDQAAQDQIRTITQTLIEKVPVYVTPAADARCIVPLGFVREHDAAASGDLSALPTPPAGLMTPPPGLRSLPSPEPSRATTEPAAATPGG